MLASIGAASGSRLIMRHNVGPPAQIEVFYELNSAAIQGAARAADDEYAPGGADDGGGGQTAEGGVFRTQEDRAMLIAMMLHCADISNATKPRPIAER